jgi:hypothetical protein
VEGVEQRSDRSVRSISATPIGGRNAESARAASARVLGSGGAAYMSGGENHVTAGVGRSTAHHPAEGVQGPSEFPEGNPSIGMHPRARFGEFPDRGILEQAEQG